MASSKGNRVFVWIILILLFVGLIGFGATGLTGNATRLGTVGVQQPESADGLVAACVHGDVHVVPKCPGNFGKNSQVGVEGGGRGQPARGGEDVATLDGVVRDAGQVYVVLPPGRRVIVVK